MCVYGRDECLNKGARKVREEVLSMKIAHRLKLYKDRVT